MSMDGSNVDNLITFWGNILSQFVFDEREFSSCPSVQLARQVLNSFDISSFCWSIYDVSSVSMVWRSVNAL